MKPDRIWFMLYLRVLLKYLQRKQEQGDGQDDSYEKLRTALYDCAARKRRGEVGYESLTAVLRRLLPEIVAPHDMVQARRYLHMLRRTMRSRHGTGHSRANVLVQLLHHDRCPSDRQDGAVIIDMKDDDHVTGKASKAFSNRDPNASP